MITTILVGQSSPPLLEPIPPPIWQISVAPVQYALIPERRPVLWMIGAPAFDGEYAIAVINTSTELTNPKYILRYSKSSKIIGLPPPPPVKGEKFPKSQLFNPKRDVTFQQMDLNETIAIPLIRAWGRALKLTHYQGEKAWNVGLDGASYLVHRALPGKAERILRAK